MKFNCLMIGAALLAASSGIAQAERNPTPPPSGIVIHLFGPDSILDLPGETPAHPAPAAGGPGTHAGAAANGPNNVGTSDDPDWHDVLHKMFVVGDPNDPNKPSAGRQGERPNAQ